VPKHFHFPGIDERAVILGRTGSGKTQLGAYILARAPFDKQPYVIVDFKRDKLLNSIDRIREMGMNEIPTKPGVYIIHPLPGQDEDLEKWLWDVWSQENIGLFFDEGTLVPDKAAFSAVLRQGRSKNIPVITLSQRPVDLPRSVYTESEHIAVMSLQDERDKKTVSYFTPDGMLDKRLKKFHSYWYNIGQHDDTDERPWFEVAPVPDADKIRELLQSRLAPRHRIT
jgi:hypothetical protein